MPLPSLPPDTTILRKMNKNTKHSPSTLNLNPIFTCRPKTPRTPSPEELGNRVMASNKGGRAGGNAGLDVKLAISEAASRTRGEGGGTQSRQILKPTPEPTSFQIGNDHDDRLVVVVFAAEAVDGGDCLHWAGFGCWLAQAEFIFSVQGLRSSTLRSVKPATMSKFQAWYHPMLNRHVQIHHMPRPSLARLHRPLDIHPARPPPDTPRRHHQRLTHSSSCWCQSGIKILAQPTPDTVVISNRPARGPSQLLSERSRDHIIVGWHVSWEGNQAKVNAETYFSAIRDCRTVSNMSAGLGRCAVLFCSTPL